MVSPYSAGKGKGFNNNVATVKRRYNAWTFNKN
jgi:hypothetical protein